MSSDINVPDSRIADHGVELYGAAAGNCRRVAIAFEEAGIPFTVRHVDLRNGEHKRRPYLDLNPAGQVPTIVDYTVGGDPLVLTQSNAIILYAASKAPGKLMLVNESRENATILERFFYFLTDVIGPSQVSFYLHGQGYQEASRKLNEKLQATIVSAERFVAQSRFMAGDKFSIADIVAFTITAFVKDSLPLEQLPNLRRWLEDIEARPAVQRGLHAFDGAQ